ncbi:hypothetical protein NYE69_26335 [Paenibacillus sp. FSL R5-0527]|uniref:hypothetical protein n=1 Tax=Paenibacillus sp. FSL R5-0527 TaxID=2975321 RepID=UPI00097ABB7F|nr:hypothetical protein BK140_10460 [Paenibacillus macerans]
MRKFLSKAIVEVMYSQKTWNVYKTGVWLMETALLFVGLLALYAGSLLCMYFTNMQLPSNIYSPAHLALLAVIAAIIAFYRSLGFKPEQKVLQAYQKSS